MFQSKKIEDFFSNPSVNTAILMIVSLLTLICSISGLIIFKILFLFFITCAIFFPVFPFLYFGLIVFESVLDFQLFGGSILRLYDILLIAYFLRNYRDIKDLKLPIFFVSLIILIIISNFRYAILDFQGLITAIVILIVVSSFHKSHSARKLLLLSFILSGFANILYGIYCLDWLVVGRFYGVVKDPNYTALLLFPGFFGVLSSAILKSNLWRFVSFVIFLFAIMATSSLTAFITLVITLILKVLFDFRNSIFCNKKFLVFILASFLFLFYFTNLGEFIGGSLILFSRISETMEFFSYGDYSGASSGRSTIFSGYMGLFLNAGFFDSLFGFYPYLSDANLRSMVESQYGQVSHNSYVDILLYTGFFGLFFVSSLLIKKMYVYFWRAKVGDPIYLDFFLIKVSFLIMSTSLSLFPFKYFMFFILI